MSSLPELSSFEKRLAELDAAMSQPEFFADSRRAAVLSKEHMKLRELLEAAGRYRDTEKQIVDNRQMAADTSGDPELRALAAEELPQLEASLDGLLRSIHLKMVPPDPSDSRNTIVEIRAGAGGDEASLFAADLHRMYTRFAESRGWKVEMMSASVNEAGGYKEVSFLLTGEDAYKALKFESGVHRVQRVPSTEASGRIHTSTVTVAVLPEAEEVDIQIDPSDLEVTVARASGPGGQGVNTTDSAVQILHKPTGMIVKCADERSQIKNRLKAMKVLRSRLLEQREREEREKYAANRRSQIGTGDRSERIRTYNFPQSRLTDHRINLTTHSLTAVLEGELDEVIGALQEADLAAKIRAATGAPEPDPHAASRGGDDD